MPKVYDPILCMMVDKQATKTADARATDDAAADFKAMQKQLDTLQSMVRKYARKIDSNYFFNVIAQMKDKLQYYVDNAGRGWYD